MAFRVTSPEYLQFVSTRRVLHCLLRICKAFDAVVDIWVSIPCTAGTPFKRINEKLGAETGDFVVTYMLVVAVVGLCRHAVGDEFSCKRSNGNELWSLLVARNHVAKYGILFCWDSTAAVGQQLVDREGGVSYVKLSELFKKVMSSSPMVLHMLGFLICFVGTYVLTSLFLSVGDAENLSLLTSDTYGVAWADVQSTVEIVLVMKLPAEQTRRLSWRLGLASALMVAHGYSGEIQDNLLVRWSWWALAMVPFCFVVRPDGAAFVTTMSGMTCPATSSGDSCAVSMQLDTNGLRVEVSRV